MRPSHLPKRRSLRAKSRRARKKSTRRNRPVWIDEHTLGIRRLPQQEPRQSRYFGRPDHEIGIRQIGGVEVGRESSRIDVVAKLGLGDAVCHKLCDEGLARGHDLVTAPIPEGQVEVPRGRRARPGRLGRGTASERRSGRSSELPMTRTENPRRFASRGRSSKKLDQYLEVRVQLLATPAQVIGRRDPGGHRRGDDGRSMKELCSAWPCRCGSWCCSRKGPPHERSDGGRRGSPRRGRASCPAEEN